MDSAECDRDDEDVAGVVDVVALVLKNWMKIEAWNRLTWILVVVVVVVDDDVEVEPVVVDSTVVRV